MNNVSLINGHIETTNDNTKPNVLPKEAFEELKVLNEGSKEDGNRIT